jgi:hypothetical protein
MSTNLLELSIVLKLCVNSKQMQKTFTQAIEIVQNETLTKLELHIYTLLTSAKICAMLG